MIRFAISSATFIHFGLDVIGLTEFVDLLELPNDKNLPQPSRHTNNFRIQAPTQIETEKFLEIESINLGHELNIAECRRSGVFDEAGLVGVALLTTASALDNPSRSAICVRQEHPFSSTIADFLISEQVRYCSNRAPCKILMDDTSSHPITRRIALGQGFQQVRNERTLAKISLGEPITVSKWNAARLSIERLSGIKLQPKCPAYDRTEVDLTYASGAKSKIELFDLETLLSPTLFAFPKRPAVIVPITRSYAADLLGTDLQHSFLEVPEAHFLSRRTYFNTTRAANVMIRGAAIAFYESQRSGGVGAVVAIGRIVDVTSIPADSTPEALERGGVVAKIESLTKSSRVLATTFDNLLCLRKPVPLKVLRQIGCVGGANLVSATGITAKQLSAIIDVGWVDD